MFGNLRRHPILTATAALVFVLAVIAGARLLGGNDDKRVVPSPPVVVTTAAELDMIDEIKSLGTAHANESVDLTARVTDTVRRVNFDDGMIVEKGTILVELTDAEESAQLAEARAEAQEADKQYERIQDLVTRGNASKARLDSQLGTRETAHARVDAIAARLADRLILAPFTGVLGFRNVSPGTLITPTTTVATLDDISVIKLDFTIPENFLAALRVGQSIIARSVAYPGRDFEGMVTTINSRVNPITRAVTVRARIENEDSSLRPGMLLTVSLIQTRARTLVVPEAALITVRDKNYVFRLKDENIASWTEVEVGRRWPGLIEITRGISAGDRVVTEGTSRVKNDDKVNVLESRTLSTEKHGGEMQSNDKEGD